MIDNLTEENLPQNSSGEKNDDMSTKQIIRPNSSINVDEVSPHQPKYEKITNEDMASKQRQEAQQHSRVLG